MWAVTVSVCIWHAVLWDPRVGLANQPHAVGSTTYFNAQARFCLKEHVHPKRVYVSAILGRLARVSFHIRLKTERRRVHLSLEAVAKTSRIVALVPTTWLVPAATALLTYRLRWVTFWEAVEAIDIGTRVILRSRLTLFAMLSVVNGQQKYHGDNKEQKNAQYPQSWQTNADMAFSVLASSPRRWFAQVVDRIAFAQGTVTVFASSRHPQSCGESPVNGLLVSALTFAAAEVAEEALFW